MFYVGQKVVCVDASYRGAFPWLGTPPVEGVVYTIAGFNGSDPYHGELILRLVEIQNPARRAGRMLEGYLASRFRPVTDISALQAIVAEVKTGKRRKIKADKFDKVRT